MGVRRYYTVTQEREVKICAESPAAAVLIADSVFRGELPLLSVPGEAQSDIRERDISAREDY